VEAEVASKAASYAISIGWPSRANSALAASVGGKIGVAPSRAATAGSGIARAMLCAGATSSRNASIEMPAIMLTMACCSRKLRPGSTDRASCGRRHSSSTDDPSITSWLL
jgi:hypothetical protein